MILLICPWLIYFVLLLIRTYLLRLRRFLENFLLLIANLLCFPFIVLYSHFRFLFRKPREPTTDFPYIPIPLFYGPPFFSVDFKDAVVDSSSMTLSAIRIPIQWCQPSLQHNRKDCTRTRAPRRKPFLQRKWTTLLSIFAIGVMPGTYAIPGTNHAIIVGASSNDLPRQHAYAKTAIDHIISANAADTYALGTDAQTVDNKPQANISQIPYCFIADTDNDFVWGLGDGVPSLNKLFDGI
jgi:hypothetical protein